MTVLIVLVVVLVLVAGVLVVSDQAAARLAERKAASYLAAPLGGPARVHVHGEPFLTQAIRGRYADVELSGAGLRLGEITDAELQARLHNVYLPLRALLGRSVAELPCERVVGTVLVPYGNLVRLSRVPTLRLDHDGRRLNASVSMPLPGLGSLARVGGEALLTVDPGGEIWLRMRGIAVAGISVPSIVLSQLLPALRFPIPLPALPYGLRIAGLDARADGILVHGGADAVVFRGARAPRPLPRPTT